ncbi:protein of unknown function [Devosia crocina]|uniref:DUF4214 domain-containing protein n=1 Tax=Devosia crocina TaxID=429728 RepID=A0A1I7NEN5_9HYPH|nr:DUF4214 domain-containing protein [Devosia crocina]SFV33125.1 protein of unknown function [Devosia crocina]
MSAALNVQKIYIAFFNRPADAEGVEYWAARIEAGVSLGAVASSFVDSPEFKALYAGSTNAEIITSVYRNLFGREPDAEGLAYWEGVLDRGQIDAGMLAYEVLMGAGPADRVIVENKTNAAAAFTAEMPAGSGMYDGDALVAAREWLKTIDDKPYDPLDLEKQIEDMFGMPPNDDDVVVFPDVPPPPAKYTFDLGNWQLFLGGKYNLVEIPNFNAHEHGIRINTMNDATFVHPEEVFYSSYGLMTGDDAMWRAVLLNQWKAGDGKPLPGNGVAVFSYVDEKIGERTFIFVDDGTGLGANGPGSASLNLTTDLLIEITGYEQLDIVGNRVGNLFFYD